METFQAPYTASSNVVVSEGLSSVETCLSNYPHYLSNLKVSEGLSSVETQIHSIRPVADILRFRRT